MKPTNEQIEAAASVLYRVVTNQQVKLEFGVRKRQEIMAAFARGENPQNYRTKWLRESRAKTVKLVQQLAAEFNRTNPHDAASVWDILDVLSMTSRQFQDAVRKAEAKKQAG